MFIVMVIGYGMFTLIQEMKKMNVIRWRKIEGEWVKKVEHTKIDFSKENLLTHIEDCHDINYADVVFHFTPDVSDYANQGLFLIQSYVSGFTLYKGKFNRQIIVKDIPYCSTYRKHNSDGVYKDDHDMLVFRLFDIENQRAVFWGALRGYPFYNGKVNRVTLFRDHIEEYDGYYKVEQEDKR